MVTIDGPAASGKSSVSRELAQRLGWNWVSTGAFYRGLGFVAQQENADLNNEDQLASLVNQVDWSVEMTHENTKVIYKGTDCTDKIFLEEIGSIASKISHYPKVRQNLLQAQRDLANNPLGLVAEGRDCGTVVFPTAPVKIYLTARSDSRAKRRAEEQGRSVEETIEQQKVRDAQDSNRKTAPLQVPEGAHVIDTSELNLEQVVNKVEELVRTTLKI